MTSLPITGNAPQPANTANMAYGDRTAPDAQAAEPFASLLARQISESDPAVPDTSQVPVALDITDPAILEDIQDQTAIATGTMADPANAVAAMLLQIPQEMRASNSSASNTAGHQNSTNIDGATQKNPMAAYASLSTAATPSDKTETSFLAPGQMNATDKTGASALAPGQMNATDKTGASALAPGQMNTSAAATGKQTDIDAATQNAPKDTKLPSELALPAQDIHPAINSPVISQIAPNMLAGNKIIDTPQTIATPLGSGAWADDFSQKISWMSTQKNQIAELHLNPPDLGPLNVVLKISDNQATALFTSPHSAVRDAVENAIPKLREILADNGIMLGNTTVSDQSPRDRNADGSMNQSFGTTAQRTLSADTPKLTVLPAAQVVPARRHNGMVDTFA